MEPATREHSRKRTLTRDPREQLIANLPVTERRLKLNGIGTSVLEGGDGAPIVLLHGPGAYGAQSINTIPVLVRTYRVIAPDLPGHGASDFFDEAATPARVAGWLDDLIQYTCATPPVLVGHALGGGIAARFAAGGGRLLAALVLVDTLGLTAFRPAPAFGSALRAYLRAPSERTHDCLWVKSELGIPAIAAEVLERIETPTTLIWGRHDRATLLSVAEAASEQFGWRMEVIDDAADAPNARTARSLCQRATPRDQPELSARSHVMRRMLFGIIAVLALSTANAHEDEVLEWNRIAFDALLDQPPPLQMRFGAIVQLAVFEGVNAVTGDYESTLDALNAPRDASAPAAAVSAAHHVLMTYLPERAAEFDAARDRSLVRLPEGPAREAGIAAGKAAAIAVMAAREHDGSESPESYLPNSTEPGNWQPTKGCPPTGGVFLHWRNVKTFVMRRADQFRTPPPPPLDSVAYARAYIEVLVNGARDSAQPPDRTKVAKFYATFGDAALWNPVARQLAQARRQTLTQNARTFALMNLALHDLTVALMESKYHYHFWRPETAIPAGGTDGNGSTEADASFVPLIDTPCHPSYPSGHAATSGAARAVLEHSFGLNGHKIVVTNPAMPGVVLRYSALDEITDDIDDARVFGGIHFRFDQAAGAEQGRRVGNYVWRHALKPARQCAVKFREVSGERDARSRSSTPAHGCTEDDRRYEAEQQARAADLRKQFNMEN